MEPEIIEMRREWDELKTRAFYTLVALVTLTVTYGIWIGSIETRVGRNESDIVKNDERSTFNEQRLNAVEITNSSTNARLTGIEAVLQEIKVAVKQLQ